MTFPVSFGDYYYYYYYYRQTDAQANTYPWKWELQTLRPPTRMQNTEFPYTNFFILFDNIISK